MEVEMKLTIVVNHICPQNTERWAKSSLESEVVAANELTIFVSHLRIQLTGPM